MKYWLTLAASTLILSGCSLMTTPAKMTAAEKETLSDLNISKYQPATRDLRDNIDTQELLAQATFWSHEYNLNPADLEATIKFSATLRKIGNAERAVEITRTTRALHPEDPYLQAEHAAALIENQQPEQALKIIDPALGKTPQYARLWSLKGVALDQLERYAQARPHYNRALSITPNDPKIMSNLGLNYALSGNAKTAHQWMSRAAALPNAPENAQTNLALIEEILQEEYGQALPQQTQKITAHSPATSPTMRPTTKTLPFAPPNQAVAPMPHPATQRLTAKPSVALAPKTWPQQSARSHNAAPPQTAAKTKLSPAAGPSLTPRNSSSEIIATQAESQAVLNRIANANFDKRTIAQHSKAAHHARAMEAQRQAYIAHQQRLAQQQFAAQQGQNQQRQADPQYNQQHRQAPYGYNHRAYTSPAPYTHAQNGQPAPALYPAQPPYSPTENLTRRRG